jgi:hypothetical protein
VYTPIHIEDVAIKEGRQEVVCDLSIHKAVQVRGFLLFLSSMSMLPPWNLEGLILADQTGLSHTL